MGLFDLLFGDEKPERPKRVFISFAMKDVEYRDHLVSQARNNKSPFEFMDMSVKRPWKQSEWKKKCRTKIKKSDAVIALLSKNTWHAGGARWEMKCAIEEEKPIIGMHIKKNDRGAIPPELKRKRIITWSWKNIEKFVNKVNVNR
jgi:nucleoside 2-deoxyribosyltransferase